ncbi:MAG: PIN domain-containing protein [Candidatus Dormibacteraceae bacterium]
MAFSALLDACVLYPVGVRDMLLSVADHQVYQPRWSSQILDEMERNVLESGRSTPERLGRMRQAMNMAFPAACVEGYESLIPTMTNHPDDRHVLAAAVRGDVGVIVTENLRHFPASACAPFDIDVQSADEFLSYALDQDPAAVVEAVRSMAAKRTKPPHTVAEILEQLGRATLPTFAQEALVVLRTSGRTG